MINKSKLNDFVKNMCINRDESHGYNHMLKVKDLAFNLLENNQDHLKEKIYIVAMLHDVADHKYDHDGLLNKRLFEFLKMNFDDYIYYFDAINCISYSKECKWGHRWYKDKLPGDWLHIRDIVSDADKLDALGKSGLDRCKMFQEITYYKTINQPPNIQKIFELVKTHSITKLFHIEEYIRTDKAQILAKDEIMEYMRMLVDFYDQIK
jgi:HD superfamily phosphodiesterase